ncbi:MAG: ATP synthase F1 subunit epsilon [Candidatus Brocadiae bacterium]|nr:ATP synthase F1 subunit epsilon [Candidatus Brocadiia bacterium]
MAKEFQFEVVTPERTVFSKSVTSVIMPAHEGYLGVLAGHAPLLALLQPGEIVIRLPNGEQEEIVVAGGFADVGPKKCLILADAAETPEQVSVERARKAYDKARQAMSERKPGHSLEELELALKRAENRLKFAQRRKKA